MAGITGHDNHQVRAGDVAFPLLSHVQTRLGRTPNQFHLRFPQAIAHRRLQAIVSPKNHHLTRQLRVGIGTALRRPVPRLGPHIGTALHPRPILHRLFINKHQRLFIIAPTLGYRPFFTVLINLIHQGFQHLREGIDRLQVMHITPNRHSRVRCAIKILLVANHVQQVFL